MITEQHIEMQKDIHTCFIDYAKAFDKVQHVTLFEILQELDVNGKYLELMVNSIVTDVHFRLLKVL